MLIAESEDGRYEPVAVVSNVGEAREVASQDSLDRMRRLSEQSEGMCPYSYKVWARGIDGKQQLACEIQELLLSPT